MTMRGILQRKTAELRSWLRAITHRSRLEAEMQEELQNHLEARTADLIRAGYAPGEAARRARIEFGPALMHKEEMRASLGLRWFDELVSDLRYAARMLRKSRGFTLIAVVSLALAIGANTTIFSAAKYVLYRSLSVPHPQQLRLLRWKGDRHVAVHMHWGGINEGDGQGNNISPDFSYPVYQQLRLHNPNMQDLFAFKLDQMNATVRGDAQRLWVEMVSGNYYAQLGVTPQLGRSIQPSDDLSPDLGAIAVISDSLWDREFGRSPTAIGQAIKVNGATLTIVGVNPRGFTGTSSALSSPDLFVPLAIQPLVHPLQDPLTTGLRVGDLRTNPDVWWLDIMARIKPGVPDEKAKAALNVALAAAVRGTMKVRTGETLPQMELTPGSRGLHTSDWLFKKPITVLMAMVLLVLLLACVNIANLLMAQGAQRQREMRVRLAMGAGRPRLLRQTLTESLLLAALGGAGGLVLGYLARNAVPSLLDSGWQASGKGVVFDWRVFGFTAAMTVATGLLFGSLPAWITSRAKLTSGLKDTGPAATSRRRNRLSKMIVALQVALSTLLVVGGALFLRTLFALDATDVGLNTDNLLLFDIGLPDSKYPAGAGSQFFWRLQQEIERIHGVEQAAPMMEPYLADSMSNSDFFPEGESYDSSKQQYEDLNVVGNNFLQTLQIPLIAGRSFGPQDTVTSQKVAIINEKLARERFPGTNPIGKQFKTGDGKDDQWIQIVGVCGDTHYDHFRGDSPAQFFLPYLQQRDVRGMTFAIRTHMPPGNLIPAIRRAVQSLDRDVPAVNFRTQQEQINATLQVERTFALLTSSFGLLALILACVGIYGVMAYSVAQRTNEIGIRIALGAQPRQVRTMVLRESTVLTCAGILAGVAGALGLGRLIKSMLYGIRSNDPLTLVASVALLLLVALLASWIPAHRAASVQPMEALRHE